MFHPSLIYSLHNSVYNIENLKYCFIYKYKFRRGTSAAKMFEELMMCMAVVSQKKTQYVLDSKVFVPEISTCQKKLSELLDFKVDNEEFNSVMEADPSQTMSELAAGCSLRNKTNINH